MFTFPNTSFVDVQSRISSFQKLARCYFMTLKDAAERAPVLPFFVDYVKFNTVEESISPQSKKL